MNSKPNIVFILTDDQGAWAMNCAGNGDIITPNLNRLAENGILFDNCFCTSPVCSPARASILTGTIPSVHGVQDWLCGGNLDKDMKEIKGNKTFINEDKPISYLEELTTYTDLLCEAGYTCALSGKWHLGNSMLPQHGFSRWFTIGRGGCEYFNADVIKHDKLYFESRYITDVITEDALENLDYFAKQDNPFYLSVHYTAPHSPWNAKNHKKEILDMYKDCQFTNTPDLPTHPNQVSSAPYGTGEVRKDLLRGYYSAVTAADYGIGKILNKLEEKGLSDNTIVIFTSDNGMNMGHHGVFGKGNGTFPLNMYDTSVKVPFIISIPNSNNKGAICSAMISHYDILPTFIDCLKLTGNVKQELVGKSFGDILRGNLEKENGSIVIFDEYGPVRMIRNEKYKYVHRYPYGPCEFFDLENDPDEENNLFDLPEYLPIIESMRGELYSWFYKYVDPRLDGSKEGIEGSGQLGRAGLYSNGKDMFLKL